MLILDPYGASHCRTELKKMPIVKKFNFIESLSSNLIDEQRHPDANDFIKKFSNKKVKDELLRTVFHIFNDAIFEGKVSNNYFYFIINSYYLNNFASYHVI